MLVQLQLTLFLVAVITAGIILHNIRMSKIQIEDSIFWFFFSAVLLIFAIFPGMTGFIAKLIGISSPANFVFLIMIFLLLVNQYRMTKNISKLEFRLKELVQIIAIKEEDNDK